MVFEVLKARFFEALDRENGSISGAARAVGVNRATAYGWARKAGVRGRGKTGTSGHPGHRPRRWTRRQALTKLDATGRTEAEAVYGRFGPNPYFEVWIDDHGLVRKINMVSKRGEAPVERDHELLHLRRTGIDHRAALERPEEPSRPGDEEHPGLTLSPTPPA
jgi:hypothetical protein